MVEIHGGPGHEPWDDERMIEIRATAPDEYRTAANVMGAALLHGPASDDDWAKSLPSWEQSDSLTAWDGERCVAHVAGYRFDTIVPGGARLATNGVTRVGVLSTHRRRGLLRTLMTRLLTEAHERGQVLASLRASETPIYQRYGFGLAGELSEANVVASGARPFTGAATGGSLRMLRADEVLDTIRPIYDRVATRPGVLVRPDWMWERYLRGAVAPSGGDGEFVVVHASPGPDGTLVDDGFVHYAVKWKTANFTVPEGRGEVYELWGADASIELALWEYLCSIDLVREWYAEERPVDDPAAIAAADVRAYSARRWDEQWLRLLDVDAALAARTYGNGAATVGTLTVAVSDELLPHNAGTWEIGDHGAKRVDLDPAAADLAVDVRELAAEVHGGVRMSALAAIGRVDVREPRAVAIADALFVATPAPYCGSGF